MYLSNILQHKITSSVIRKANEQGSAWKHQVTTEHCRMAWRCHRRTAERLRDTVKRSSRTAGRKKIPQDDWGRSNTTTGPSKRTAGRLRDTAGRSSRTTGRCKKIEGLQGDTVGRFRQTEGPSRRTTGQLRDTIQQDVLAEVQDVIRAAGQPGDTAGRSKAHISATVFQLFIWLYHHVPDSLRIKWKKQQTRVHFTSLSPTSVRGPPFPWVDPNLI